MSPQSMSSELIELENRLRSRTRDELAANLRQAVIRAVASELAMPQQSSVPQWDGRYWAAAAAAALIVLNLSMIFAAQDAFSIWPARSPNQMTAELQAIQQLEAQQEGIFK